MKVQAWLRKHLFIVIPAVLIALTAAAWQLWVVLHPTPCNPWGKSYVIPSTPSEVYPNAVVYDFDHCTDPAIPVEPGGRNGTPALEAVAAAGERAVINLPLANLTSRDLRTINLSGWLWSETVFETEEAAIVVLIDRKFCGTRAHKTVPLRRNPAGRWFHFATLFETGDYVFSPDDRLRIYFRAEKGRLLCDDLTLQFGLPCYTGPQAPNPVSP